MFNNIGRESPNYIQYLLKAIWAIKIPIRIMEVCGTHTMAIARSGMKQVLPDWITLLSGPGCPVCVTDETDIDLACALADLPNVILASYGDMMRVPGTDGSLMSSRLNGADIRVIYSSNDALRLAVEKPSCEIVLLSVGFETTAPTTAITIETVVKEEIKNFSVLSLHKAVPPILRFLLLDPELSIDAFLLPGHVCTITGADAFNFIAKDYSRPCVVAGFEPVDILEAIFMVLLQQQLQQPTIEIQYQAVRKKGNVIARKYVEKYFHLVDCTWRGIGIVPLSGYAMRDAFGGLDARKKYDLPVPLVKNTHCVCGDILKGRKEPIECALFATRCNPASPVGPCMISEEGSCAASFLQIQKGK
ncbi:hydrogenase expression/formation protein HypD [Sporomusaceae bacterium BoRhaA]|uniref:hydrogenase formation protein HypD n=1 Tax=Pelorhabdus rhamnosifermentans TaxID=2772457 RepID=UPI001C0641C6|nr:hydrogenase formation protein HypD [Pelorhabdus rhamnosifermentans]MBU2701247.1 hydrogenase expression/formation protein HypD [Pelorhabdus rhamnosifermentans]